MNSYFQGVAQLHLIYFVTPGLDPGVHGEGRSAVLTWIAGSSPAMTAKNV
jgi:hypothetical protein